METAEADSPAVMEAVEQSAAGIAIDMAGVQFLSSSGLRLILAAHQRAENSRKKMALVRVQPAVYKIFKVSALDGKFRFFETETEAVDSLTS
jgi:anti-anti-sigma factor